MKTTANRAPRANFTPEARDCQCVVGPGESYSDVIIRVAGVRENAQNSAHPYADDFVAQTFTGAHHRA
jgi:hypothetical protein